MPTSSFYKFNCFVEDMAEKVHNLGSDTFKVAFCAAANAPVATNTQLSNLTQATTNMDSVTLAITSSAQSSGTYSHVFTDKTMTASAGGTGPFRYVVVYNDTTVNKNLLFWYDYGSDITVASGETFLLNFGATTFTLA